MFKNIIYLDEEKLYSFSSQIFEGVTEYVLSEHSREVEGSEQQKGPVGSGKVLGDILKQQERVSEKRFLSDHSYVLFENRLLEKEMIVEVNSNSQGLNWMDIPINTFVKVRAKAIFNDIREIQRTIGNFNKISASLANVTTFKERESIRADLAKQRSLISDRKQLMKFDAEARRLENLGGQLEAGFDAKFLEDLSVVLDYGFQEQLEIRMNCENIVFRQI